MLQAQKDIISIATTTLSKHDTKYLNNIPSDITVFPIKRDHSNSKFSLPWQGPMRVVNYTNNGSRYTLHNLVTDELEDIHVTKFKTFNFDTDKTDPKLIAYHDQQLEIVESIFEHRGDPKGKEINYSFLFVG